MNSRELLNALSVAERLKDTTRHCYTSKGRHESVAEHSWMMTLMAFLCGMSFQMLIWIKLFVCVLFMIWVNALQETFLPLIKSKCMRI